MAETLGLASLGRGHDVVTLKFAAFDEAKVGQPGRGDFRFCLPRIELLHGAPRAG